MNRDSVHFDATDILLFKIVMRILRGFLPTPILMNETFVPKVEAVQLAGQIATLASECSAIPNHSDDIENKVDDCAGKLQKLAREFPNNLWLNERVKKIPNLRESGDVPRAFFDEVTLGCYGIYSQFKHLLQEGERPTANAA